MNIIDFLKNGSGIHIKPENKGKFTKYCHGKVTSECIAKGKRSSNPVIRKRATFADNARHFKHQEGGILVNKYPIVEDSYLDSYFKNHPLVSGMAIGKGMNGIEGPRRVVFNPYINLDNNQKKGLYIIENIRHTMDSINYNPEFQLTPTQIEYRKTKLKGTPYETNDKAFKQSIISRILVGDTKDFDISDEQKKEALRFKYKKGGKAFVNGVSVLDSNPDAYKYVKKKYKMRSAQQGTKLDQFFSSDLGQFAMSTIGQLYDGIKSQSNYNKFQKLNNKRIKSGKEAIINNIGDTSQEAVQQLNQLKLQNPDINYSSIDLGQIQQQIANQRRLNNMQKANQWELDQLQQQNYQINAIQGNSGIGDILSKGLGLIGDYYSNKNSTKNNYVKSSIKNQFSGSMLNTDPKTFFNLT